MTEVETLGVVRFGRFELDLEREELRRDGKAVGIQPQPLRVLALLVAQRGRLVSRDELQRRLWGDSPYLDVDRSLNHTIRKLRQVLDDDARSPSFIQTVPRRGYRFAHEVESGGDGGGESEPAELSPPRFDEGGGPLRLRVMPFRDLALGEHMPPLAEGMVEELISVLVRFARRGLAVIDPEGAEMVSEDERRDFLLRGAVRVTGSSVRTHARLIRQRDGCVVGTVILEEKLGGLFELQRALAERIVAALVEPMLGSVEAPDAD